MSRSSFYSFKRDSLNNLLYNRGKFNNTKTLLLGGTALLSWYTSYIYLTSKIDEDCSLIRQTMFNLKRDHKTNQILGENYSIESGSIKGDMGMIRGYADITFRLKGDSNAIIHVIGKRKRGSGSWSTELLEIETDRNSPIITLVPETLIN